MEQLTVPIKVKKEFTFYEAIDHFSQDEENTKGDSYIQTLVGHLCEIPRLMLYGSEFGLIHLAKVIAVSRKQLKDDEKIILKKLVDVMVLDEEQSWGDEAENENTWDNTLTKISNRPAKKDSERLTLTQMASLMEVKETPYNSIEDVIKIHASGDNNTKKIIERVLIEAVPYKSVKCKNNEDCKFGKSCRFAHSPEEIETYKLFNQAETRQRLGYPYRKKP